MLQGFLLGLANGTSCVAFCAPIFLPFILGEGRTVRRNFPLLIQFLAGRLGGYLLFGVAAWQMGRWIQGFASHGIFMGTAYLLLAALLMAYGFSTPKALCAAEGGRVWLSWVSARFPSILPVLLGLLTGLTLCPPFLAAFADASSRASLADSLAFFAAFFMGTAMFFIPLPFTGLLRRFNPVRIVGRLACAMTGCYYLYKSLILFYAGFILPG
jgi:sulfite exporter TauE/SafE